MAGVQEDLHARDQKVNELELDLMDAQERYKRCQIRAKNSTVSALVSCICARGVACYALPTPCPVLTSRAMRIAYAISGTGVLLHGTTLFCAMSSTGIG
eukprot:182994-Rhodomonas_salina.1